MEVPVPTIDVCLLPIFVLLEDVWCVIKYFMQFGNKQNKKPECTGMVYLYVNA